MKNKVKLLLPILLCALVVLTPMNVQALNNQTTASVQTYQQSELDELKGMLKNTVFDTHELKTTRKQSAAFDIVKELEQELKQIMDQSTGLIEYFDMYYNQGNVTQLYVQMHYGRNSNPKENGMQIYDFTINITYSNTQEFSQANQKKVENFIQTTDFSFAGGLDVETVSLQEFHRYDMGADAVAHFNALYGKEGYFFGATVGRGKSTIDTHILYIFKDDICYGITSMAVKTLWEVTLPLSLGENLDDITDFVLEALMEQSEKLDWWIGGRDLYSDEVVIVTDYFETDGIYQIWFNEAESFEIKVVYEKPVIEEETVSVGTSEDFSKEFNGKTPSVDTQQSGQTDVSTVEFSIPNLSPEAKEAYITEVTRLLNKMEQELVEFFVITVSPFD